MATSPGEAKRTAGDGRMASRARARGDRCRQGRGVGRAFIPATLATRTTFAVRPEHRSRPPRGRGHHPRCLREADQGDSEVRGAGGPVRRLDHARCTERGARSRAIAGARSRSRRCGSAKTIATGHRSSTRMPSRRRWLSCPNRNERCSSCGTSAGFRRPRSPSGWERPRPRSRDCITAGAPH